jgi:hypothetical protein
MEIGKMEGDKLWKGKLEKDKGIKQKKSGFFYFWQ